MKHSNFHSKATASRRVQRAHPRCRSAACVLATVLAGTSTTKAVDYLWAPPDGDSGEWRALNVGGLGVSNWGLGAGNTFPDGFDDTATIQRPNAIVTLTTGSVSVGAVTIPESSVVLDIVAQSTANIALTIDTTMDTSGAVRLNATGTGFTTLNGGSLTINPGGRLDAIFSGVAGASPIRNVGIDVVNQGTFLVENGTDTRLNKTFGVFTNTGNFGVQAGGEVTFGTASVFNQNGGSMQNNGSFEMSGDTFNFNGGTVSGNAIVLENSTLNIGAGSTGVGSFVMRSAGSGGGSYSGDLAAAQTLTLLGTDNKAAVIAAANGFANSGVINLDSAGTQGAFFTIIERFANEHHRGRDCIADWERDECGSHAAGRHCE